MVTTDTGGDAKFAASPKGRASQVSCTSWAVSGKSGRGMQWQQHGYSKFWGKMLEGATQSILNCWWKTTISAETWCLVSALMSQTARTHISNKSVVSWKIHQHCSFWFGADVSIRSWETMSPKLIRFPHLWIILQLNISEQARHFLKFRGIH